MFHLNDLCCICLCVNKELKRLCDSDGEKITYYVKLTSSIPELCFNAMDRVGQICKKCCDSLDTIYTFRQKCLKNKPILLRYISQLHLGNVKDDDNLKVIDVSKTNDSINHEKPKYQNVQNISKINLHQQHGFDNFVDCNNINLENSDTKTADENEQRNLVGSYHNAENEVKCEFTEVHIKEECDETNMQYEVEEIQEYVEENCNISSEKLNTGIEEHQVIQYERNVGLDGNFVTYKNSNGRERLNTEHNPYECTICKTRFASQESIILHMRIHTDETIYECNKCNKKFEQMTEFNEHMLLHTENICHICNMTFTDSTSFYTHMRLHTEEMPYDCIICKDRFTHKIDLTTHMRVHIEKNTYECILCNIKFNCLSYFNKHMLLHTGEKPCACSLCAQRFTCKSALILHMRTHSGERPYECHICTKKFKRTAHLNRHIMLHTGEKMHEYNVSEDGILYKTDLTSDTNMQEKKAYECTLCNKAFYYSSHFNAHMLIHTREKPRVCSLCTKSFTCDSALSLHMRTHTGERPHGCNICKKRFRRPAHLSRHMMLHSTEKKFECNICKTKFYQSANLAHHLCIRSDENTCVSNIKPCELIKKTSESNINACESNINSCEFNIKPCESNIKACEPNMKPSECNIKEEANFDDDIKSNCESESLMELEPEVKSYSEWNFLSNQS